MCSSQGMSLMRNLQYLQFKYFSCSFCRVRRDESLSESCRYLEPLSYREYINIVYFKYVFYISRIKLHNHFISNAQGNTLVINIYIFLNLHINKYIFSISSIFFPGLFKILFQSLKVYLSI